MMDFERSDLAFSFLGDTWKERCWHIALDAQMEGTKEQCAVQGEVSPCCAACASVACFSTAGRVHVHVPPTLTLLFTVTGLSWSIYYNFAVELH